MAYAQWVSYTITCQNFDAQIKNAKLEWGKFYQWDDKDDEISASEINKIELNQGTYYNNVISSCGRENATSGTEGSFDMYNGDTRVATFYWDCPWGSKTNYWEVKNLNEDYYYRPGGGSKDSGAIGTLSYSFVYVPISLRKQELSEKRIARKH